MAATEPGPVEFHIHQVVVAFQVSIDKKTQPRNFHLRGCCSNRKNRGMNAMKIRKVVGRGGQEAASNKPVARESINGGNFFKALKNDKVD